MNPTEDSTYPEPGPRWLLRGLVAAMVVAVFAAFWLGPGDGSHQDHQFAALDTTTSVPRTAPPTSTSTTVARSTTTTTVRSTTTMTTTTTANAPTTTAVAPAPPRIVLVHCSIEGDVATASGTVTNGAGTKQDLRAHALVVDGGGATVADLSTDITGVGPQATVAWSVSKHLDATALSRAASCRSGSAELLP